MRWEPKPSVFIFIGAALFAASACGPTSQDRVTFLPNANGDRAENPCVAKLSGRSEKVVGGEKSEVTVPVCGIPLDAPAEVATKEYKVLPTTVGYKVGVSGEPADLDEEKGKKSRKKRLSVTIEVGVDVPVESASAEDMSDRIVDRITTTCRDKILKLWALSRMESGLSLILEPVSPKSTKVFDHVLYLDGSVKDGFAMAQWPDRARFFFNARSEAFSKCQSAPRGPEMIKCQRQAEQSLKDVNDDFCIQLTQMTAHYLGLTSEDAKVGKCMAPSVTLQAAPHTEEKTKDETKPKATAPKTPSGPTTLFDYINNPELRGAKFWEKARFTPADRKKIMDAACAN